MKYSIIAVLLLVIVSCKKNHDEPSCSWFPITSGISYIRTVEGNNTPPYPSSVVTTSPADNNTKLIVGEYQFTITDCNAGTINLTQGSELINLKIFDKAYTDTSDTIYSNGGVSVVQRNSGTDLSSVVRVVGERYPRLGFTFTPYVGVSEIQYLNSITGKLVYRWKKN